MLYKQTPLFIEREVSTMEIRHFQQLLKKIACFSLAALSMTFAALPASAAWKKDTDGNYYYTDSDGKKSTGFVTIGDDTYYFDKNGKMLTGTYKIGDTTYRFGKDGKMYTGWLKLSDGNYSYFLSSGKRATGFTKIGSANYYFKSDGVMLKSGSYKIDGATYKFGSDGKLVGEPPSVKQSFLNGYFGESYETVTKRRPTLINMSDDSDTSLMAIDTTLKSVKVGKRYAIGMDMYLFADRKFVAGVTSFDSTSNTEYTSLIEETDTDSDVKAITESEATALFNSYKKLYDKKYGKTIDLKDYGYTFKYSGNVALYDANGCLLLIVGENTSFGIFMVSPDMMNQALGTDQYSIEYLLDLFFG
jgi:hypothetical protein